MSDFFFRKRVILYSCTQSFTYIIKSFLKCPLSSSLPIQLEPPSQNLRIAPSELWTKVPPTCDYKCILLVPRYNKFAFKPDSIFISLVITPPQRPPYMIRLFFWETKVTYEREKLFCSPIFGQTMLLFVFI